MVNKAFTHVYIAVECDMIVTMVNVVVESVKFLLLWIDEECIGLVFVLLDFLSHVLIIM